MQGMASRCFDINGTGQQRSPGATALLRKLVGKLGGTIVDVRDESDDEIMNPTEPFYGPPFEDFFVDGSGRVVNETIFERTSSR